MVPFPVVDRVVVYVEVVAFNLHFPFYEGSGTGVGWDAELDAGFFFGHLGRFARVLG